MKTIKNFKKTQFEIGQILAKSENIQRLLVIDDKNISGDFTIRTFDELIKNRYISFTPLERAIENIGRNTFVIIVLDESNFENASGTIYIGTDESHSILSNNSFRLLELIDEIAKTIDNKKLSAAGVVNITHFTRTVYSDFSFGYKIYFNISDQNLIERVDF